MNLNKIIKTKDKLVASISFYNLLSVIIMLPAFLVIALPSYTHAYSFIYITLIIFGYLMMLVGALLLLRNRPIGWVLTTLIFFTQLFEFKYYYLRLNPIHFTAQLEVFGVKLGIDIASLILIIVMFAKAHNYFASGNRTPSVNNRTPSGGRR